MTSYKKVVLLYIYINKFFYRKLSIESETSGQDGYAVLPCTTKRRTTRNLKTKHNQNCQKT